MRIWTCIVINTVLMVICIWKREKKEEKQIWQFSPLSTHNSYENLKHVQGFWLDPLSYRGVWQPHHGYITERWSNFAYALPRIVHISEDFPLIVEPIYRSSLAVVVFDVSQPPFMQKLKKGCIHVTNNYINHVSYDGLYTYYTIEDNGVQNKALELCG